MLYNSGSNHAPLGQINITNYNNNNKNNSNNSSNKRRMMIMMMIIIIIIIKIIAGMVPRLWGKKE